MKFFQAKCDYTMLAKQYGTPLYLYDIESIQSQFNSIKNSFSGFKSLICYALKANSNLSIIKTLANLGSGADCVSLNEVKRAMLAGIPPYKIIFSGVGKEDYEIYEAIKLGILFINVESEMELLRIENITKEIIATSSNTQDSNLNDYQTRISIRVNPDVDAKTHPYISTGLHENKFGLDIQNAKRLYLYAHKSEFLNPVGIHYHIGSQILDSTPLLESTEKILDLAKSLQAINVPLRFFDIGGGFGIPYKENQSYFDIQTYIQQIIRKIDALNLTAICEPGRFIMGNSGALLTKVIGEKTTEKKRFVITDCAMNDLLRPSLYQAHHHISYLAQDSHNQPIQDSNATNSQAITPHTTIQNPIPDSKPFTPNNETHQICDVVGAICESGDYVGKEIALPQCKIGDLLLIESAGAYGYSMASNYNSRMRPAEVAIYKDKSYLIKEREDFDESVKNELACLKDFT